MDQRFFSFAATKYYEIIFWRGIMAELGQARSNYYYGAGMNEEFSTLITMVNELLVRDSGSGYPCPQLACEVRSSVVLCTGPLGLGTSPCNDGRMLGQGLLDWATQEVRHGVVGGVF